MIEKAGNFWDEAESKIYDAIVCTICQVHKKDGTLVMGAGIAKEYKEKFEFLPKLWGKFVKEWKYACPIFTPVNTQCTKYVIGLPTKYHFAYPSDLKLIEDCCILMEGTVNCLGLKKILMTRPGCGLGKLNWDIEVKPKLEKILDDKYTIIDKKTNCISF